MQSEHCRHLPSPRLRQWPIANGACQCSFTAPPIDPRWLSSLSSAQSRLPPWPSYIYIPTPNIACVPQEQVQRAHPSRRCEVGVPTTMLHASYRLFCEVGHVGCNSECTDTSTALKTVSLQFGAGNCACVPTCYSNSRSLLSKHSHSQSLRRHQSVLLGWGVPWYD